RARALAQQEQHLSTFPRLELEARLQGGARIQSRPGLSRKRLGAQKRRGRLEAGVSPQELEAVAGHGCPAPAQVGEGDPVRELRVPRITREQGAARPVDLGDHEWS